MHLNLQAIFLEAKRNALCALQSEEVTPLAAAGVIRDGIVGCRRTGRVAGRDDMPLVLFARDLGYDGPPFAWDEDRRARLRAELDAWYALAYGLTRDELRYVLDPKDVMGQDYPSETFRVLKTNAERKYGEYRTRRLVLAAYDELVAQGMRPRTEGFR